MIDAGLHRLADFGTESTAAQRRVLGEELSIEPCRAIRRDLLADREVGARGERQTLAAVGIVIDTRLDDRARRCVAGEFEIAEAQMVGPPVDAGDDGIGRALELVVEAALNKLAEDRIGGLLAMQGEAC